MYKKQSKTNYLKWQGKGHLGNLMISIEKGAQ